VFTLVCGKVEGFTQSDGYYVKDCATMAEVDENIRNLTDEGYVIFRVETGGKRPFEGEVVARIDYIAEGLRK
jgi:hypothetical protein